MTRIYKATVLLLSWWLCLGFSCAPAQAQKENYNWNFGNQAGITFATGSPVAVTTSAMTSYEGCASVSNGTGQLLMYSNGEQVWGANNQVMPNGFSLGGHNSSSQAALILPAPGSTTLYYLFTVDAIDTNMAGGLRYSLIDMSLRGGLGDVTATKSVRLPTPGPTGKVTEKLAAALHANGQDYWIVVHGWQSNVFYSFQLSAAGISPTPVASAVGGVHQGGGSFFGAGNAVGCMRISPSGTKLALAQRDTQFELYDFNNASGSVSNYISLTGPALYYYGVEFSPDNSRLYATMYSDGGFSSTVLQYNLLAGSAAGIKASQQTVGSITGLGVGIQAAPNGKIYLPVLNQSYLNAIEQPNALGTACGFRQNAVPLGARVGQNCLPNFPNTFIKAVAPTATFLAAPVCLGTASSFAASTTPAVPTATYAWDFGEPSSGGANVGNGPNPTHIYGAAGTYTVTLSVLVAGFAPVVVTQPVTVNDLPVVSLSAGAQQVCEGRQVVINAEAQPVGSTYLWQDGSTGTSLAVTSAGTYSLIVTSPSGCSSKKEIVVNDAGCPFMIPNVITPNGDKTNEFFVLKGLAPQAWKLEIYNRWGTRVYQTASYNNDWNAAGHSAGVYYYLLRHTTDGRQFRGWLEVVR